MELLAGISARDRARFTRALTALPVVVPTEETWTLAESWIAPAADAGHRFAITDLLIGAMAHELGGLVWSLDGDFARLESLGYAQRYDMASRWDSGTGVADLSETPGVCLSLSAFRQSPSRMRRQIGIGDQPDDGLP